MLNLKALLHQARVLDGQVPLEGVQPLVKCALGSRRPSASIACLSEIRTKYR